MTQPETSAMLFYDAEADRYRLRVLPFAWEDAEAWFIGIALELGVALHTASEPDRARVWDEAVDRLADLGTSIVIEVADRPVGAVPLSGRFCASCLDHDPVQFQARGVYGEPVLLCERHHAASLLANALSEITEEYETYRVDTIDAADTSA